MTSIMFVYLCFFVFFTCVFTVILNKYYTKPTKFRCFAKLMCAKSNIGRILMQKYVQYTFQLEHTQLEAKVIFAELGL